MKFVNETKAILLKEYSKNTKTRTKLIDLFLVFNVVLSVIQLVYEKLVSDYPFNSFLAGFFCTTGIATLTACLRTQVEYQNTRTEERAYFEYLVCCLILYLVVFNYLG